MVDVVLNPKNGYTNQQVVSLLQSLSASDIQLLGNIHISAKLDKKFFVDVEKIAFLQEKRRSTPK